MRKLKIGVMLLLAGLSSLSFADSNRVASVDRLPWIELRVPYDTDAKELAGVYYSDESDYGLIYHANRNRISKNLKLHKGMLIKIPITDKFSDQPEILGWN